MKKGDLLSHEVRGEGFDHYFGRILLNVKRIEIDMIKSNDLEKMVLFESKGHKGYEFKEIPMYEIWQNNHYELPKIIS